MSPGPSRLDPLRRPPASDRLRVALADDEPLARDRIRTLLADEPDTVLVGEYRSGEEAVSGLINDLPDIVFLDVRMPALDGLALAERIQSLVAPELCPVIVFVTAYDGYAIQAFDVSATDYLLKPFDRARFRAALARARQRVRERGRVDARFVVRTGSKVSLVRADDVECICGEGNYVRLHAGGRTHLVRETLKSVEARLDSRRFLRVHRSAIINVDRVATLEPFTHGQYIVTMKDGSRIVSSRTRTERLRALLKRAEPR
jgi:two-component system LytT family response regulator